ncbi:hypothetical protein GCM10009582_11320 [Arthrobacter flavus]
MIPTLGWGRFKPSQEAPRVARWVRFKPSQWGHLNLSQPAEVILQQSEVMAAEWVPLGEVLRRLNAGVMADPWIARLDSLWPSTTLALSIVPEVLA